MQARNDLKMMINGRAAVLIQEPRWPARALRKAAGPVVAAYCTLPKDLSVLPAGACTPAKRQP